MAREWWRDAVLYQIYPRSWVDSNADGIGDLAGIASRLDYLEWLGIDAIWLNPITPSPNADWGYDVNDYCDVDPKLGTLADLDLLIAEASGRGIRVLLDLVPNHSSDRHPWFVEARSDPASPRRSWYVWADPGRGGGPPNNWLSAFGGPAWTLDELSGQYYLHVFLAEQPDLNWWNEDVRAEFDRILRFWFDRGVAGFRIDVAHRIVKDQRLRDNLPVTEDDHPHLRQLGQRRTHDANQPEVHEVHRRWRRLADVYDPPRLLLGETYVLDVAELAPYYGGELDGLHLAFNFVFVHATLDAHELSSVVDATRAVLPPRAWPVWTGSNHDAGRLTTRWCGGDERKARCALLVLLMLPGTPVLYYGDEIGLPDVEIGRDRLLDPVGVRGWPEKKGRDVCRTPMPWTAGPGAGFTDPDVEPWLPIGDADGCNVAAQRDDPASMLTFCRDAIVLRRGSETLRSPAYEVVVLSGGLWAWRRGELVVAVNLADGPARLEATGGTVALSTSRRLDGATLRPLDLEPWEGVVLSPG